MMSTHNIRKTYLEFFSDSDRRHQVLSSASLLPENDPTTLFTGSGMQPMVPFLLGQTHPKGSRLTDSQKCFRAQDIDEVGDNRHTTFFEMLGNWSLGDYFKEKQIPWMYAFLTEKLGLDPARLYVTCFRGNPSIGIEKDETAAHLWKGLFEKSDIEAPIIDFSERDGMQGGRIFYYDETKNWWSRSGIPDNMPVGEPGGPDTEMFWDFAPQDAFASGGSAIHANSPWADQPCHVNCDCGRFMEIGNNVFMQYKKTPTGFEQLSQKNVDFGGGLERLAAAVNDNPDVFTIDLFDGMRRMLEELSGRTYGSDEKDTYAFRVIMDHLRAATFLIADGAVPSNKDQGYFTRRLIRRSVRFATHLGIDEQCIAEAVASIIAVYREAYPELLQKEQEIIDSARIEEEKFRKALARGAKEYDKQLERVKASAAKHDYATLATIAFDLYQTHGLPVEVFTEYLTTHDISYDEMKMLHEFDAVALQHQEVSRQGAEKKFKGGLADHSEMSVKYHTATHLLHIALRKVLGTHVEQKGSNITPERLRFDFSHPEKMTPEQIKAVEDLVNAAIARDYPVSWQEVPVQQAYDEGVIGFFPERYDDLVKVYTVGDPAYPGNANPEEPAFSREICGGPHVEHTGVLGHFKITKEEACSAGVRRIKAVLE